MELEIKRSGRKTLSIEVKADMRVVVHSPLGMKQAEIDRIVKEKTPWIEKQLAKLKCKATEDAFSEEELKGLTKEAKRQLPPLVDKWAEVIGVGYGTVSIRHQTTRWGSCSAKGNINLNCLLMLCPAEVREYVVVHELCHILHLNHSGAFWKCVEKYCPDYATHRRYLKEHGNTLISKLKNLKEDK